MKKIPEPELSSATVLKPAQLNTIHFGGIHTPLSPEQIKELAQAPSSPQNGSGPEQKKS